MHSYQSLAHRKHHLPLRPLLCCGSYYFSCSFCRCFFVCGFFCRCFLISLPLSSCFCRLQLSLSCRFHISCSCRQPLSQLLLWLFQQLQLPLSFLLQLQLLLPFSFLLQYRSGLNTALTRLWRLRFPVFSLRLKPLSSLLLRSFSICFGLPCLCRRFRCRLFSLLLL